LRLSEGPIWPQGGNRPSRRRGASHGLAASE